MKALLAGLALALACALPAHAHEFSLGNLHIEHPWARATAPGAANGAAYFTIELHGSGSGDRLLSAASPAAARVELHTHLQEGGVMKMRPVEAIDVQAGASTKLAPGGLHVMLFELKQPLAVGAKFPLTLTFEHAGSVTVEVEVQANAPAPGDEHHGAHGSKP